MAIFPVSRTSISTSLVNNKPKTLGQDNARTSKTSYNTSVVICQTNYTDSTKEIKWLPSFIKGKGNPLSTLKVMLSHSRLSNKGTIQQ